MRLRIRELSEISETERMQMTNGFVWAAEGEAGQNANHWLVTLENCAVVIGILVPKAEVKNDDCN